MKIIAWPAFKTKYKNPYNWLLYSHMQQQGVQVEEFSVRRAVIQKYDICHLHWPVETIVRHPNPAIAFGRAALMLIVLDIMRLQKTRVVWTIHDEKPHSIIHPGIAQWFQNALIQRIDGGISLCNVSQFPRGKWLPDLALMPHQVIPHGHYREVYPSHPLPVAAKPHLGLAADKPVLLFLGYIDYYKNVPGLIQIFQALRDLDWQLLIAGKVEVAPLRQEIIDLAAEDPRIHLHLRFIPDEQLQTYFQVADLVVLPFTEILNSGSALLALSFDCPLLVPRQGALVSLQEHVGTDWVKLYEEDLTPSSLAAGLQWASHSSRPAQADLSAFDWSTISQATLSFYQTLLDQP